MSKEIEFGDVVIVDHSLKRKTHIVLNRVKKQWQRKMLKKPKEAIFLGKRTISDGERYWEEEIGYSYGAEMFHDVFLVVTDANTNPFYVIEYTTKPIEDE